MYFGEHSIRFYPDESRVGTFLFDSPDNPEDCPDTWERWHLIPTGKAIFQPPEHKQNLLEIPGRHGLVNVNKYTFGRPVYGARTGDIEFVLDPDYIDDWPAIYSDMMRYLHGQERFAVLRDDRYYYYKGFFDVSDLEPGEFGDTVKLTYTLDPFKYERWASDEEQLWDDFDFRQGTLRDYSRVQVAHENEAFMTLPIMTPYTFSMPVTPAFFAANYDSVIVLLTMNGSNPLKDIFDLVSAAPVRWNTVEDAKYGSVPDFGSAYVDWPDSPDLPERPSNPGDHSVWPQVLRKMLAPDWKVLGTEYSLIDAIGATSGAMPNNSALQVVAEEAAKLLSKLYSLSEEKAAGDTAGKALQLSDIEGLLPGVAEYLYLCQETAAAGIVQASIDGETWVNVYAHRDPVSYEVIDISRCKTLRDGTASYVHLRRGFDFSSAAVPEISVSMRGGTL